MKSILIIGLGKFGHHLCSNLVKLGNQVMIVDEKESVMEDLLFCANNARIGDCTNIDFLKTLGIPNFDICFVCIGNNFQSGLEITSLIKEMGAKYVISKATRDIQAKFLLRNGADDVIYPDRDIAEKMAVKHSTNNIFDYVEVTSECSIYEILPLPDWINQSLKNLDIRKKYNVNILGIKEDDKMNLMLDADYIFKENDHVMVIGRKQDVDRILEYTLKV